MKRLCILGATGSIGAATLEVVASEPGRYVIDALAAGRDAAKMAQLCRRWQPRLAVMADEVAARELQSALTGDGKIKTTVRGGSAAVCAAAADDNNGVVVAAISGAGGVESSLAAAAAGKRLLLANKESLVVAGDLLMRAVKENGGELLPIDSEHCALFELLAGGGDYKKLWLTASGGGARDVPLAELDEVTVARALAHPNWSMGRKITIDSATMMNKALEIIEAAALFGAGADAIGVVMHPQSLFHALVEYADGTMTAAISTADMKIPIARMLAYPAGAGRRRAAPDWAALSAATFAAVDERRYPALSLAAEALARGGAAAAVLSAANEVAVARFLAGDIKFTDIAKINAAVLRQTPAAPAVTLDDIWRADAAARAAATRILIARRRRVNTAAN